MTTFDANCQSVAHYDFPLFNEEFGPDAEYPFWTNDIRMMEWQHFGPGKASLATCKGIDGLGPLLRSTMGVQEMYLLKDKAGYLYIFDSEQAWLYGYVEKKSDEEIIELLLDGINIDAGLGDGTIDYVGKGGMQRARMEKKGKGRG